MAIEHASPGEVIDVRPLGARLSQEVTKTLIKTAKLEVLRLVVPAGKEISTHQVPGEVTVQCLEGSVAFRAGETTRELEAGRMLFLAGDQPHSVRGIEDASLLITILLEP